MILFSVVDWTLFVLLGASVLYLFVYALFSLRHRPADYPSAAQKRRFAMLIPAYKGDDVIAPTIAAAMAQDYPADRYRVVVIADKFRPESLERLARERIELLAVDFEQSSKAKALNHAMAYLGEDAADVAVILDVDNLVAPDFLSRLNDVFDSGVIAVQAHRKALNRDTDTAVLDAVSEEINNSIFRRGHVALGLSSALIGSGMAFDYGWFRRNVGSLETAGEDKELEILLLRQGIFIEYLDDVEVLDEKTRGEANFSRQRRRWLATQFHSLGTALRNLPDAILRGNVDYVDKLVQWMMPPRILLLGVIPLWGIVVLFVSAAAAVKWGVVYLLLLFALAFATPDYLVDDRFKRALRRTPKLFVLMAVNLFRLRGAGRTFIHTAHGESPKND